MKAINVLSLFDGMSCGQIALERSGIKVGNYFASEIDRYAIHVTQKNYNNTVQLGDINNWKDWNIDFSSVDLILAGNPCQSFSYAGNQQSFADEKGKLFFVMNDIIEHCKSKNADVKFLVENVRMKREFLNVFNQHLGTRAIFINSSIVSALNRPRYYWTNLEDHVIPLDKGILLKDILEPSREDMPWLSEAAGNRLNVINKRAKNKGLGYKDCILTKDDKYLNLDASYYKGCDGKRGVILQDGSLRMLTVTEAERLQTIPEGYTSGVSNTQRYKMLGNGWTVDVICCLLNSFKEVL